MTLNERIIQLEEQVKSLESKIKDLSANVEEKFPKPTITVGNSRNPAMNFAVDFNASMGNILGNGVIFNDSELKIPAVNTEPALPTEAFNKHSHSRYSGGALIANVLEIIEYDATDWALITNKHSQAFWQTTPKIAKAENTNHQQIDKIGYLDLIFNPDNLKWGTATYEIDIKKCYFVERDANGNIVVDSKGQEKKSFLYNADTTKSSIIWDENGNVWRLFSVYASGV